MSLTIHDTVGDNTSPLVSICIPAYNAERFIEETLESALAQDYRPLEIIVSDDGSTDRTPQIVEDYTGQVVRLLRQVRNLGMSANWNAVIRASEGKYVCKLDADDLLEPPYISRLTAVMEATPGITFAHCACRLIDEAGRFLGYERSVHGSFIRPGLVEWPRYVFGPRAVNIVLLRRAAYEAAGGYDESFAYSGDWKMHRDLLKLGAVYYHDAVLASYRVHQVGKAGVRRLQAREHLLHLEDMAVHWPPGVPGQDRLLGQARRRLAWDLVIAAAQAEPQEARQLLELLPLYGKFGEVSLLARLVRGGAAGMIRWAWQQKLKCRQAVKKLFYKRS